MSGRSKDYLDDKIQLILLQGIYISCHFGETY